MSNLKIIRIILALLFLVTFLSFFKTAIFPWNFDNFMCSIITLGIAILLIPNKRGLLKKLKNLKKFHSKSIDIPFMEEYQQTDEQATSEQYADPLTLDQFPNKPVKPRSKKTPSAQSPKLHSELKGYEEASPVMTIEKETFDESELRYAIDKWIEKNIKSEYDKNTKELNAESNRIARLIEGTFGQFGVEISLVNYTVKDSNFIYNVRPAEGVRINDIKKRCTDAAVSIMSSPIELTVNSDEGVVELLIPSKYTSNHLPYPLIADALYIAISEQCVSTAMLQRKLEIGYQTAARLIDEFDIHNIITVCDGSSLRTVSISAKSMIEQYGERSKFN